MPLAALIEHPEKTLTHWPTEPMLVKHDPRDFHQLLRLDEVNDLIDNECVPMRNLVLIKDGKVLERHTYADPDGDMPQRGIVRQHLDEGGTISLRQLQTVKPSLARLQQEIHQETGCLVHVNAYMTPPHNQGLKYHYDPYVTLIVQLAGRKTWPLHRPVFENPMKEHGNFLYRGFTPEERYHLANTPPEQSFTLEPGDVFWLPRGYVHSPYTEGDETSLHLTFALKERTRHWVAERLAVDILGQALLDPAMRAEIQPAELTEDPRDAVKRAREYLIGALLTLDQDEQSKLVARAARRLA
ncbi:cupin domain-containing protein [Streptomyces sp. NBC_01242]|uniref:JmjC domain-containing protein n=1 Tax=Streptomyces sp. NBC_01242 TaxID=2903795 RepID=UPI002254B0DF|nr:cupin domain-containing protein [Streptomyces sp. NBC_01242]MCX4799659.1 cupin domain-containing protein [Streptomyces sp. NBC_01242]